LSAFIGRAGHHNASAFAGIFSGARMPFTTAFTGSFAGINTVARTFGSVLS
jgi:hypothetical protein